MGRPHIQPFLGFGIHPAADNPPAGKHQRVRAVLVEDGEFKVAAERRIGYGLPHSVTLSAKPIPALTYVRSSGTENSRDGPVARRRPTLFDLDQITSGGIRRRYDILHFAPVSTIDFTPPPPDPPLPGLWRRHAGQQVAGRLDVFRQIRVPELPHRDQRNAIAWRGREIGRPPKMTGDRYQFTASSLLHR